MRRAWIIGWIGWCAVWASAHAQDYITQRLETSPRHHEWIKVRSGDREVSCFVAFPEVSDKATAVLVVHENRGLVDWVRGVADQLAEAGYLAVAPDLLSGKGPGGGGTAAFASQQDATRALYELTNEAVDADLVAVAQTIVKHPAANGKLVAVGFCWGGSTVFRFAARHEGLQAACVFYGSAPDTETLRLIRCPVYGFYGGNDARITAAVPDVAARMKELGKTFEPVTYDGAGHGFMRAGEPPDATGPNKIARDQAWQRLMDILKKVSQGDRPTTATPAAAASPAATPSR